MKFDLVPGDILTNTEAKARIGLNAGEAARPDDCMSCYRKNRPSLIRRISLESGFATVNPAQVSHQVIIAKAEFYGERCDWLEAPCRAELIGDLKVFI